MQSNQFQNAYEFLDKAEKGVNNLQEFWKINRSKLGDMYENIDLCRAFTMTYNNLGVLNKK